VAVLAQQTAVTAPALFESVAYVMCGGRWIFKCTYVAASVKASFIEHSVPDYRWHKSQASADITSK